MLIHWKWFTNIVHSCCWANWLLLSLISYIRQSFQGVTIDICEVIGWAGWWVYDAYVRGRTRVTQFCLFRVPFWISIIWCCLLLFPHTLIMRVQNTRFCTNCLISTTLYLLVASFFEEITSIFEFLILKISEKVPSFAMIREDRVDLCSFECTAFLT